MIELARRLNRKGDLYLKKNGIKKFHQVASDLLGESNISDRFDFQEIIEHSFNSRNMQNFKNLEFSDLPVTISRGQNCFIDLYFWRRRPTVIHNHHFAGAFMCLLGKNVDLEFKFTKTFKLGRFHDQGKLDLKQKRILLPGDVASIAFMDKFIHQNHHQADLSVNLCFRTPQVAGKNLSNYLYSGLRYEKDPELLGRVAKLVRFLNIGEFNYKKVNLSTDDAINFLIQTFETSSLNPRLLKLQKTLNSRVLKETGVNIISLLKSHDKTFEKLLDDYE